MGLLYAFSGRIFWAISPPIDTYPVDGYFRHADTRLLMIFTAMVAMGFALQMSDFSS